MWPIPLGHELLPHSPEQQLNSNSSHHVCLFHVIVLKLVMKTNKRHGVYKYLVCVCVMYAK